MKRIQYSSVIIYIIPIFIFIMFPTFALSESIGKTISTNDKSGPMVISSNMFEIDNKDYIVTFLGDVNAKRDNLVINCQKIQLYYSNTSGEEDSEKIQANVEKIIATGDVKIRRLDGDGMAMSEKAVYYHNDEKVVLTGKPVVRRHRRPLKLLLNCAGGSSASRGSCQALCGESETFVRCCRPRGAARLPRGRSISRDRRRTAGN